MSTWSKERGDLRDAVDSAVAAEAKARHRYDEFVHGKWDRFFRLAGWHRWAEWAEAVLDVRNARILLLDYDLRQAHADMAALDDAWTDLLRKVSDAAGLHDPERDLSENEVIAAVADRAAAASLRRVEAAALANELAGLIQDTTDDFVPLSARYGLADAILDRFIVIPKPEED